MAKDYYCTACGVTIPGVTREEHGREHARVRRAKVAEARVKSLMAAVINWHEDPSGYQLLISTPATMGDWEEVLGSWARGYVEGKNE